MGMTHTLEIATPFGPAEFTITAKCTPGWSGSYHEPPESDECEWTDIEAAGVEVEYDLFFELLVAEALTAAEAAGEVIDAAEAHKRAVDRQDAISEKILLDWNNDGGRYDTYADDRIG